MKDVIMFCGKGGVGKTTCAAATALHYADEDNKTLIISTDPTPSLRHVFELDVRKTDGEKAKPRSVAKNLSLFEVGADEAKAMWNKKFGAEVYEVFASFVDIGYEEFVEYVTTILPGLRDELMVDYIRELYESATYGKIIWDTAPAGQTLGLLRMPSVIGGHLKPAARIYTSLKTTGTKKHTVQGVIKGWEDLSNKDIKFLKTKVEFNFVTIAEALAVYQLEDIFSEFKGFGLGIDHVIINQVVVEPDSDFLMIKSEMQKGYMDEIGTIYPGKQQILPMRPYEIKGLERLREAASVLFKNG
jgi:arsenite-transporting ATPase